MFNLIDVNTKEAYELMIEQKLLPDTQKESSKVFGVRESTLNGWVNNDNFSDQAKSIMKMIVETNDLKKELLESKNRENAFIQDRQMSIPVYYKDEVLIIQLFDHTDAIYQYSLKGRILAICDCPDNATEILDGLNTFLE